MSEIPEPGDRAIVMWTNGDVPVAVYVRIDYYAEEATVTYRWYMADAEADNDGPERWVDLCKRMDGWNGPYLLNVGELLEGGSNA